MPSMYDISIWKGSDYTGVFRFCSAPGVPIDLTGRAMTLTLKSKIGVLINSATINTQNAMSQYAKDVAIQAFGAVTGCIDLSLSAAQTASLELGSNTVYIIDSTLAGRKEAAFLYGSITAQGALADD